jgi:hypothetical protein
MLARFISDRHRSTTTNLNSSAKSTATSSPSPSLASRGSANTRVTTTATTTSTTQQSISESHSHPHTLLGNPKKTSLRSKTMAVFSRSPTTNTYERLEGGMGPLSSHAKWKWTWTWRKFAIGAVVLIGLVWLAGPRATVTPHSGEQWGLPVKGGDYRQSFLSFFLSFFKKTTAC